MLYFVAALHGFKRLVITDQVADYIAANKISLLLNKMIVTIRALHQRVDACSLVFAGVVRDEGASVVHSIGRHLVHQVERGAAALLCYFVNLHPIVLRHNYICWSLDQRFELLCSQVFAKVLYDH